MRTAPRPPAPFSATNNECQIKFELIHFIAFDDRHSAASTYRQLGTVALEQHRFEEAEAAYNKALEIYAAFNDRHSAALTYQQLGKVAEDQRHFDAAEAAYKQALEIFIAYSDSTNVGIAMGSLGRLWRVTGSTRISATVAAAMNIEPAEAETLLKKLSSGD